MLDEAKIAISENGGTFFSALVAGAAGVWALLKLAPAMVSNLSGIAKSNEIHSDMLTTLRAERDEALARLDALHKKYDDLFREWAALNAQLESMKVRMEALQTDLGEANTVISSLHGNVRKATRVIDRATIVAPATGDEPEGVHHA